MKLAWILWLSNVMPQPAADSLCLTTTVYLEARDQSIKGQEAVAEVALRRRDSGLWGDSLCDVVTARYQFAPGIVPASTRLTDKGAWENSVAVALDSERNWLLPSDIRREIVPGASHFAAHALVRPSWSSFPTVAKIGGHTFYRVQSLEPRS